MISAHDIQNKAWEIRLDILEMIESSQSGHIGSALGLAEFFATMYLGGVLKYDPANPYWEGRDRMIVSNGHVCPVLYTTLAHAGFFDREKLKNYSKLGSELQGHPEVKFSYKQKMKREGLAGVEVTSGSLGQGVSLAVGVALAMKMKRDEYKTRYGRLPRVFCLMSDAELQEGQTWEAFQFAVINDLQELTFVIDRNNIQIDTDVDDVSPIEPLEAKLEAFGFAVIELSGHDIEEIRSAIERDKAIHKQPVVYIMNTIPGKGVSFMEGDYKWHDHIPSESQYKKAKEEIERNL